MMAIARRLGFFLIACGLMPLTLVRSGFLRPCKYLGLFMPTDKIKLLLSVLLATTLVLACGGDSAPAPAAGITVTVAESSVTVRWNMDVGVDYWLFYGPTNLTPADTSTMNGWIGLPGGGTLTNVSSPYVVTGLADGVSYSFSVNGRTNSGPGGAGSPPVAVTPRLAGATWTTAQAVSVSDLRCVTSNGSTSYIAAGTGGAMFLSADGSTWNAINYQTSNRLNAAIYQGGYRLVGDGGLILDSSDAVTFSPQTSGTAHNLYAVASNFSTLNVAVGASGTIITSPLGSTLGSTWTAVSSSGTTQDLYGVAYGLINGIGTWIGVGAGGTIVRSTDGVTWVAVTSGINAHLRGVAYGYSTATGLPVWVAVGDAGTVISSADGSTWTTKTLSGATGTTGNLNAVTYGTQFVMVGDSGQMFYGTDGQTWTAVTGVTTVNLYAVARGLYSYVAVGAAGSNFLSR